jgi:hypothetical protein
MSRCKCGAKLLTREQLRRGACSADCQRGHTPRTGDPALTLMPVEQGVAQKPLVQRRPAKQNWRSSNE